MNQHYGFCSKEKLAYMLTTWQKPSGVEQLQMTVLLQRGKLSDLFVAQFVSLMHGSMLKFQSFFPICLAISFSVSTAPTNKIHQKFYFTKMKHRVYSRTKGIHINFFCRKEHKGKSYKFFLQKKYTFKKIYIFFLNGMQLSNRKILSQ